MGEVTDAVGAEKRDALWSQPDLIPTSDETRGHGTHSRAMLWKNYLIELLQISAK